MEFKYIRTDLTFAIFSASETHSHIARAMTEKVTGAGFCDIDLMYYEEKGVEKAKIKVHCYGESISLGIKGDKKADENFINQKINGEY